MPVAGWWPSRTRKPVDQQPVLLGRRLLLVGRRPASIAPEPSPATAVTILNTEPGHVAAQGRPRQQRLRPGRRRSALECRVGRGRVRDAPRRRRSGSRPGPGPRRSCGSSITTAPRSLARAPGPRHAAGRTTARGSGPSGRTGRPRTSRNASATGIAGEAGQLGVVRALEAGAAVALRRVADDVADRRGSHRRGSTRRSRPSCCAPGPSRRGRGSARAAPSGRRR